MTSNWIIIKNGKMNRVTETEAKALIQQMKDNGANQIYEDNGEDEYYATAFRYNGEYIQIRED